MSRNTFILDILKYIVETYPNDEDLILIGNTAIIFASDHFKLDPIKKFEEEGEEKVCKTIEFSVSYDSLNLLLKHLNKFGLMYLKMHKKYKTHVDFYLNLEILNETVNFFNNNLFYNFLIFQKYKELGNLTLPIKITLPEEEFSLYDIPRTFLSETIYCEYIRGLNMYCTEQHFETRNFDTLTLDWVVDYCKIYSKEEKILELDQNIQIKDMLKSFNEGYDSIIIKPLKVKTSVPPQLETVCTICLDKISDVCYKTTCNHYFHSDCIARFITKYYTELHYNVSLNKNLNLEYDIHGNVIQGGVYQHSCPNCKNECFKLECVKEEDNIIIKNPEYCIFEKVN